MSTWIDEAAVAVAPCRRTIYVATAQSELVALDAADGKPCAAFVGNDSAALLEDLGSKNGTTVGEKRLEESVIHGR